MNYSTLKHQYPRVFLLFEQWVEKHHETALNIWNGSIRNEDVIEFLDDNLIFIHTKGRSTLWGNYIVFFSKIGHRVIEGDFIFKTRKESVETAITKAFELFEAKLKLN